MFFEAVKFQLKWIEFQMIKKHQRTTQLKIENLCTSLLGKRAIQANPKSQAFGSLFDGRNENIILKCSKHNWGRKRRIKKVLDHPLA